MTTVLEHGGARTKTFVLYMPHYRDPDVAIDWLCHHAAKIGFPTEAGAQRCGWSGNLNPVKVTVSMEPAVEAQPGPLFCGR